MFPISARDGDGDGDGDRNFYDKLRAEPGSRLIAGPLKIHVAPTLKVDVNVELQEGEQEHRAVRNGALVPVNILGNLLWKLHDGLAKPYERLPRDIVAGRYTSAALIRCGDALDDPFKKFDKNTPEIEAKEKADLYEMLRERYRELRIQPTGHLFKKEDGYRYTVIPFFDETKPPIKTQIVSSITLQGTDDVRYQLVFFTNGFIYWYLWQTPPSSG